MMYRLLVCILLFYAPASLATVVETATTAHGVDVWYAENHAQPLFTLRMVWMHTGAAYDTPQYSGRANLAAAMLTEGAGEMDALAFKQALERAAVKLSVTVDADHTYLTLTALKEYQADALSLLHTMLTRPRCDKDALKRVQETTLATLRQAQEQPGYLANRAWSEAYFGTHPYAHPQLGTAAGIESLDAAEVCGYLAHVIARNNMRVAVAGEIDLPTLLAALDVLAAELPEHMVPGVAIAEIPFTPPDTPRMVVVDKDVPQTVVKFGTKGLLRSDPRYMAGFVLNQILGGTTLTSRLGHSLRETSGLTYHISTDLLPMEYAGVWIGGFATRAEKASDATALMKTTLATLAERGVTARELADAKAYLIGSFALSLDTNAKRVGFITAMQLYGLGPDYLDRRNGLIAAVSKEEVDALARTMLTPETWHVVQVGHP